MEEGRKTNSAYGKELRGEEGQWDHEEEEAWAKKHSQAP